MLQNTTKTCRRCGEAKPYNPEFFTRDRNRKSGLSPMCKVCNYARVKAYQEKNPDKVRLTKKRAAAKKKREYREKKVEWFEQGYGGRRWYRVWKKYRITKHDYETLHAAQGGSCAICQTPDPDLTLAVDHCHESGAVRGLLCTPCNQGIGFLRDDVKALQRAIVYLS